MSIVHAGEKSPWPTSRLSATQETYLNTELLVAGAQDQELRSGGQEVHSLTLPSQELPVSLAGEIPYHIAIAHIILSRTSEFIHSVFLAPIFTLLILLDGCCLQRSNIFCNKPSRPVVIAGHSRIRKTMRAQQNYLPSLSSASTRRKGQHNLALEHDSQKAYTT